MEKRLMCRRRWVVLLVVAVSMTMLGASKEACAQGKIRIAVTAFENKAKGPFYDSSWKIGEGLAEMLTSELAKTGQFIVVERQALGDIVKEQELGQTGLIRGETAARTGQVLGAQIVVRGAVTEFEESASGGGADIGLRNLNIGGKIQNAHVALDIRLIDASTGQVIASHNASKVVPSAGGGVGARIGTVTFGGDAFFNTPIGQATRAAMQDALQFIMATAFKAIIPSFSIVKVDGGTAYINGGATSNVRVGDVYMVYSKGEDLVDPDTGLKLGSDEKMIGSVQITSVQEKFSIGTIVGGGGPMKRGDLVKVR
jgi:curli biogenesis system outer membrane secretion channel CsgG